MMCRNQYSKHAPSVLFPLAVLLIQFVLFSEIPSWCAIQYDPTEGTWNLLSGPVEYRLIQKEGSVFLTYFGPKGGANWKPFGPARGEGGPDPAWNTWDTAGRAGDEGLFPRDLRLVSHQIQSVADGIEQLTLVCQHRILPLKVEVRYKTMGNTGAIVRQIQITNRSTQPLPVYNLPSLALRLPAGGYELTYLHGGWGRERQVAVEPLRAGRRTFGSRSGRSSNGFSPWFSLFNQESKVRYLAQLAYSGNWQMDFERHPASIPLDKLPLQVEFGPHFDFGGPLLLRPGASFLAPEAVFTATAGDLDTGANQLHRYQHRYVVPHSVSNVPPLIQFNSWYPFPGKMTVQDMIRCADVAVELGAEVFVLDAGWFNKKDWSAELGDWEADRVAFPHGIEELSNHVHRKGLKFGIWVEIENLGIESQMLKQHPDWCLSYQGKPVLNSARATLNFAKPEVRHWARSVIERLMRDYKLDWIKIDYNNDVGDLFDPLIAGQRGDVHYGHVTSYYRWLDEIREAFPNLVVENCASGGMRFDLGIIGHTHTTWLSDVVLPKLSVQLAYGSTVEFTPQVCNHWMVGDREDGEILPNGTRGWWEFMLRVPMNGQFGISSRVFDWPAELKTVAKAEVARYARIRKVIDGADTYHLTPSPDHDNPKDWMALQYVTSDQTKSVVNVYRLAQSNPQNTFLLRGLEVRKRYQIAENGINKGVKTGEELAKIGLEVTLNEEFRASIFELEAK
jgi:alpha-galactosidase